MKKSFHDLEAIKRMCCKDTCHIQKTAMKQKKEAA